jgi:hypothetical protein
MTKTDRLTLRPIDPRTMRLHDISYLEEQNTKNEIIRLYKQHGDLEVKVGCTILYKNSPFKVNIIVRGTSGKIVSCYDLKCATMNTCSIFLTPLLGLEKSELRWEQSFINAFLGTESHDKCIALLYRFSADKEFLVLEKRLRNLKYFVEQKDFDSYHTLFIFEVPEVASYAYQSVVDGRYSEITDLWKLKILRFHGFDRDGHTGQILYKDDRLKQKIEAKFDVVLDDAELHSIPDLEFEIFREEYYKTTKLL